MDETYGDELIRGGRRIQDEFAQATLKLIVISDLLVVTSPTATHAVANAAFMAGIRPVRLRRNESGEVIGDRSNKEPQP